MRKLPLYALPIFLLLPFAVGAQETDGRSPSSETGPLDMFIAYEFGWNYYPVGDINAGLAAAGLGTIDADMLFSHGWYYTILSNNFLIGISCSRSGNTSLPIPETGDRRVRWYQDAVFLNIGTGFSSDPVFGSLSLDLGYLRSILQYYPVSHVDFFSGLGTIDRAAEIIGFGWAVGITAGIGLNVLKIGTGPRIPIAFRGQILYAFPRKWKLFDDQELTSHPQTGPLHVLVGVSVGLR